MKKVLTNILISVLIVALCVGGVGLLYRFRRSPKHADALKLGTTALPKNLMPYDSALGSQTLIVGLIYDTLLSGDAQPTGYTASPDDFVYPDGTTYEPIDKNKNPFLFNDNLVETAGAYPKETNSDYGWDFYEPKEDEYKARLKVKQVDRRGVDSAGRPFDETQEQYEARRDEAVAKTWIRYRFRVKDGITWNDGEPFTAHDIKFTFDYIMEHEGKLASFAYFLTNYQSSEVTEEGDFVMTLSHTKLSDIKTIATSIMIIPEHIWKDVKDPKKEKNINPVGTGAYRVDKDGFIDDASITLIYRDDYEREDEKFVYEPIPYIVVSRLNNLDVLLNSMQKGDIDYSIDSLDSAKATALQSNSAYQNIKFSSVSNEFVTTMVFNVGKYGAFHETNGRFGANSIKIRRAISLAIDQEQLIRDVLNGNGTKVGDGLVQSYMPHSITDKDGAYVHHRTDLDEANRLLDEAGYPKNASGKRDLKLDILGTLGNETLINALITRLAQLGISSTFTKGTSTYAEDIKQSNEADFDIIINNVAFGADKLLMFDARFGVYPNSDTPRVWNYSGVNDDALSELMSLMTNEMDILRQYDLARQVQQRLSELCVEIPIYSANMITAYTEIGFENWIPVESQPIFNDMSLKYLKKVVAEEDKAV